MILIIEFYKILFFLSFNHIFLYIIGAFDLLLFSFSRWNDNLSCTTISITKLDNISFFGTIAREKVQSKEHKRNRLTGVEFFKPGKLVPLLLIL